MEVNNKILVGICLIAYLYGSGGLPGCQSRCQSRQSVSMPNTVGIYLGNSPLAQEIMQTREMEKAARLKAYQMYIEAKLQEFQESLKKKR